MFPESLRWLMATQQFEAAKKLILHFTQKNRMDPESDIKGVMPGESRPATGPAASAGRGDRCPGLRHHWSQAASCAIWTTNRGDLNCCPPQVLDLTCCGDPHP